MALFSPWKYHGIHHYKNHNKKSTSEEKTIKIGCACKLLHVTVQQYSTSTEKDNKIALSKKKN